MILVTGATGRIGRRVVEQLLDAEQTVRVLVRSEEKASRLLRTSSLEVVTGDLADFDVVTSAVKGVESILLVSPVSPSQVELQGNIVKAVVAEAKGGDTAYIVKISGLATSLGSAVDSGRWHAQTEQQIKDAGLNHTFLRPLFFMQNLAFLIQGAKRDGVIRAGVGDAKIAMVDADDIANVVAKLLIEKGPLMNQSASLTTLDCVTYVDIAEILSELIGSDVRYEPQTHDQVKQALIKMNQPEWHVDILLQFNRAFQDGMGDAANTVVRDLLGRAPVTLKQYLERELKIARLDESSNPFTS